MEDTRHQKYVQHGWGLRPASMVVLHRSLAPAFEKFCQANNGPLPLLGLTEPGKWTLPTPNAVLDTRGSLTSLEEYSEQLRDMVTFLPDCSSSLEAALEKVGLPRRDSVGHGHVGAYETTAPCATIAGFCCHLVVTMRPIPKNKLEGLVRASCSPGNKGHPIHIGDPETLLAFTGALGCTVMTNLKNTEAPPSCLTPEGIPEVHPISQDPLHYSIASASAVQKIRELETIIAIDPGHWRIGHLLCKGELLRASLSLSHARSVLVTTGFPTHFNHEPPEETDGPSGAIALATCLQALEKEVSVIVDLTASGLFKKLVEDAVEQGVLKTQIPILTLQGESAGASQAFLCKDGDPKSPRFDHLVAIERTGRATNGNCYNARKMSIRHWVDPTDDLFLAAQKIPGISATGVSNWGGCALACVLYILNSCEVHRHYLREAVGPSRAPGEQDWAQAFHPLLWKKKRRASWYGTQVQSGVSGEVGPEEDGLPFHGTHAQMIQKLVDVTAMVGLEHVIGIWPMECE